MRWAQQCRPRDFRLSCKREAPGIQDAAASESFLEEQNNTGFVPARPLVIWRLLDLYALSLT